MLCAGARAEPCSASQSARGAWRARVARRARLFGAAARRAALGLPLGLREAAARWPLDLASRARRRGPPGCGVRAAFAADAPALLWLRILEALANFSNRRLGRLRGTPPLLRVLFFLRSTSRPFRLAPRWRRGASRVHVDGVVCVRRLRTGGLFSFSCSATDAPLDCAVSPRPHRGSGFLAGQVADLAYDGRQLDRAGGAELSRGGPLRLALSRSYPRIPLRASVLWAPQPPYGFLPSSASRAPLGEFPKNIDRVVRGAR